MGSSQQIICIRWLQEDAHSDFRFCLFPALQGCSGDTKRSRSVKVDAEKHEAIICSMHVFM